MDFHWLLSKLHLRSTFNPNFSLVHVVWEQIIFEINILWGLFVLGKTTLGHGAMDINIQGPGIAAQHCFIENRAGVITLHPCGNQCSMDGRPVAKPVRLSQGSFCSFTIVHSSRSSTKSNFSQTYMISISHTKIQAWFWSVKSHCHIYERESMHPNWKKVCSSSESFVWGNNLTKQVGGRGVFGVIFIVWASSVSLLFNMFALKYLV